MHNKHRVIAIGLSSLLMVNPLAAWGTEPRSSAQDRMAHTQGVPSVFDEQAIPPGLVQGWTMVPSVASDIREKEGANLLTPGIPRHPSLSNVSFGTICEAGHQQAMDGLNIQIQREFDALRARLGRTDFEPLPEQDVDTVYGITGELATKLQRIREYARSKSPHVQVYFMEPPNHLKLWWMDGEWAAGHFSRSRPHIYMSLAVAREMPEEDLQAIVLHEILHQTGYSHDEALEYDVSNYSRVIRHLISILAKERHPYRIESIGSRPSQEEFSRLDQVTLRGLRLNRNGSLVIGGRVWATFKKYSGAEVEIDVQKGLVTEIRIHQPNGIWHTERFVQRWDPSGVLEDVFWSRPGPGEPARWGTVTITGFKLDRNGLLQIGGRAWGILKDHPGAEVTVDLEGGIVVEVRIPNPDGPWVTEPFSRIYNAEGQLIDSFLGRIDPIKFAGLNDVTVKGFRLQRNGLLVVGGRMWGGFTEYGGAEAEFDIQHGLITEVRIRQPDGTYLKAVFTRIYDPQDQLQDVYWSALSADRLKKYRHVRIEGIRLGTTTGHLMLGSRVWIRMPEYGGRPVSVEVTEGLVTEVRIQTGPDTWHQESLARIYDHEGHLIDVFWRAVLAKNFAKLNQVTIRNYRLDRTGLLSIGGRTWAKFPNFAEREIEFDIEHGLVVEVRIRKDDGSWQREPLCRIYDQTGELKDVFPEMLGSAYFKKLNNVTIKGLRLANEGTLTVGGRTWAKFWAYPRAEAEADIEHGFVTEVRIKRPDGSWRHESFARIYDENNRLQDVFWGHFSPRRLSQLNQATVRGFQLNQGGLLMVGSRAWARFSDYGNARVDFGVDHGQLVWVRLVKDARGNPIRSRTGRGFGRTSRRLFPLEQELSTRLSHSLLSAGIGASQAGTIAETLSRLKDDSIQLLATYSLIPQEAADAIKNLDLEQLADMSGLLSSSIASELKTYSDNGLPDPLIQRLIETHLLPWSFIQYLQRMYHLGSTVQFLYNTLFFPDVEAWIRRVRNVQESRGRLDRAKHLRHYAPGTAVLDQRGREELLVDLRAQAQMLQQLLRRPAGQPLAYELRQATPRVSVVRIRGRGALNIRAGQRLHLGGNGLEFEVQGVDRDNRVLTLREVSGLRDPLPPAGELLSATSDVPLQLQLEKLRGAIGSLERSHLRTTGHRAMDRLLGLAPLSAPGPAVLGQGDFIDQRIPYRKTSEFESTGDESQEEAVQLALNKTEVTFIEGPAGTGKTTAIAEMVRQMVKQGKRVLIVSQMHQAVDNAVAAVMEDENVPVLRLGNDPSNFKYGTEAVWPGNREAGMQRAAMERFQSRVKGGQGFAMAATDMGIALDQFYKDHFAEQMSGFDVVIMDEASRETLAGALVPLSYLKSDGKVILVGDNQQLPPFGLQPEDESYLKKQGIGDSSIQALEQSIFERLQDSPYGDRVMLSTNYRSHPLIAGLISLLFYGGDIHRRGWEDFDAETLSLRVVDVAEEPDVYYEERVGSSYRNRASAQKVMDMVELYRRRGIPLSEITIITPYKPQVELLEELLEDRYGAEGERPIITTIDSYQGGENKAIIFDFVRSNPQNRIGFVKDLRRLNVGLSRAQDNLAIVWDSRTFTEEPVERDTPEDHAARAIFKQLKDYYETEVQTFFPEPADIDLSHARTTPLLSGAA